MKSSKPAPMKQTDPQKMPGGDDIPGGDLPGDDLAGGVLAVTAGRTDVSFGGSSSGSLVDFSSSDGGAAREPEQREPKIEQVTDKEFNAAHSPEPTVKTFTRIRSDILGPDEIEVIKIDESLEVGYHARKQLEAERQERLEMEANPPPLTAHEQAFVTVAVAIQEMNAKSDEFRIAVADYLERLRRDKEILMDAKARLVKGLDGAALKRISVHRDLITAEMNRQKVQRARDISARKAATVAAELESKKSASSPR